MQNINTTHQRSSKPIAITQSPEHPLNDNQQTVVASPRSQLSTSDPALANQQQQSVILSDNNNVRDSQMSSSQTELAEAPTNKSSSHDIREHFVGPRVPSATFELRGCASDSALHKHIDIRGSQTM